MKTDAAYVWTCLRPRPRDSHKGTFGAVLAVAGSASYRGAAALAVEGALAFLFGYRARKSWQALLGVNLLTQGALALYLAVTVLRHGVTGWSMIFFLPAELVITAVECGLYCRLLTEQSKARAVVYGLCANVCSAAAGACLALPVWRWVVSIS